MILSRQKVTSHRNPMCHACQSFTREPLRDCLPWVIKRPRVDRAVRPLSARNDMQLEAPRVFLFMRQRQPGYYSAATHFFSRKGR